MRWRGLETFAMQHSSISAHGAAAKPARLAPCLGKSLGIFAAALEARPVTSRERSRLVKKEQLGVVTAPDVALAALEVENAADPLPRRPAPRRQCLCVGVKAPAAVAEQRPARRHGIEFTERIDTVLQRHSFGSSQEEVELQRSGMWSCHGPAAALCYR